MVSLALILPSRSKDLATPAKALADRELLSKGQVKDDADSCQEITRQLLEKISHVGFNQDFHLPKKAVSISANAP